MNLWLRQFKTRSASTGMVQLPSLKPFPSGISKGAHMGRIGIPELLIILAIIILIFGASRLPEIGRGIGKGIRNFKDATKNDEKDEKNNEERRKTGTDA